MAKLKDHYRDEEAEKHQEVVTPPELVKDLYDKLGPDFFKGKTVIDPCVGPGALLAPLLNNPDKYQIDGIKAYDIQPLHIENFAARIIKFKYDDDIEERINQAVVGIRKKYPKFYAKI